jgi:replicative DNA helicase
MSAESLPFEARFQDLVAAYIWRSPGALQRWRESLQSGFFATPSTGHVVGLLQHHYETFRRSPGDTVLRELIRKSYPDASDQVSVKQRTALETKLDALAAIDLGDAEFIEEQIRTFVGDRAVRAFVMDVIGDIEAGSPIDGLVEKAKEAAAMGQVRLDVGQNWRDESWRRTHDYVNPDINPRISTGLYHLDLEMSGGLQGGELGVLLAPPKGFKSGTLLNFALSALTQVVDENVLYVTLELSQDLVGVRADWRTTMMTRPQMFQDIDRFYDTLVARQEALYGENELFVKYMPPKKCTAASVQQLIHTLAEEHGVKIGMVVVDYLNLMTNEGRQKEKEYIELVAATTELRAVAEEEKVPIWTAARATREAVGRRRLNIGHIAGAFEIVAIADFVAAICITEEEKVKGQARIVPIATRNDAGDKTVICEIDGSRMCITSVDARDNDEEIDEEDGDRIDGAVRQRNTNRQARRKPSNDDDGFDFSAA